MKTQCVPKFLKEELSKYLCVLIKDRDFGAWYEATPYMAKFMMMYDNIPEKNIIQSYTAADKRLNDYFPKLSEMFARKWYRKKQKYFLH